YFAPINWWIPCDYMQALGREQSPVDLANSRIKLGVNRRVLAANLRGILPNLLQLRQGNILALNETIKDRLLDRVTEFDDNETRLVREIGMANKPESQLGVHLSRVAVRQRHHVNSVVRGKQAFHHFVPACGFRRQPDIRPDIPVLSRTNESQSR